MSRLVIYNLIFLLINILYTDYNQSLNFINLNNFKSKKIVFVRHAEQDWNFSMIWQGRKDAELSGNGKKQANLLAKQLYEFCKNLNCVIYSSNTKRTKQTAEIIALGINYKKNDIKIVDGLHERIYTDYSKPPYNITQNINHKFSSYKDLLSYIKKLEHKNKLIFKSKDCETKTEFDTRVATSFNKLAESLPINAISIIVTHKDVFKTISKHIFNKEVSLNHAETRFYNFK